MATSSSSSSATPTMPVWLYNAAIVRVALVAVSIPLPIVLTYLGNTYTWSNIHWCYVQTSPYVASLTTAAEVVSHVANPQF